MSDNLSRDEGGNWYTGYNPLLVGLPHFTEISEFVDKLAFSPLAGIDLKSLGFVERDSLLVGEKVPLEPTMQTLRAAMTWWGMLETGLRARNPVLPEARRHYWAVINSAAMGAITIPPVPTRGMSIHVAKGPTGTGKTVTARRFCNLVPQVIIRKADEAAGWMELSQLIYLEVMISHDGTRGGFLTGILLQMDKALGTTYATDLPKQYRTVERLAVATVARLIAHYTGILFLDEGQIRNLIESIHAESMQMFLLMLMNSGIPLVFIGNEKAFDWVNYSQDKSRLYMNPPEIFAPIGAIDHGDVESNWDSLSIGIMGYYVLRKSIVDQNGCSKMLRRCSGGIARLALTLWCGSQRERLLCGEESIGPEDIERVYNSRAFDELRPLADGFSYRKPELLMTYPDVDAMFYAQQWGISLAKQKGSQANQDEPKRKSGAPVSGEPKKVEPKRRISEKEKFAREQTTKKKKQAIRDDLTNTLSPEDIRKKGLAGIHLSGLAAAREKAKKEED